MRTLVVRLPLVFCRFELSFAAATTTAGKEAGGIARGSKNDLRPRSLFAIQFGEKLKQPQRLTAFAVARRDVLRVRTRNFSPTFVLSLLEKAVLNGHLLY